MKIPAIMLIFKAFVVVAPKGLRASHHGRSLLIPGSSYFLIARHKESQSFARKMWNVAPQDLWENSDLESYLAHSINTAASKHFKTVFPEHRKWCPPRGPFGKRSHRRTTRWQSQPDGPDVHHREPFLLLCPFSWTHFYPQLSSTGLFKEPEHTESAAWWEFLHLLPKSEWIAI